jgi:hypothetical protein
MNQCYFLTPYVLPLLFLLPRFSGKNHLVGGHGTQLNLVAMEMSEGLLGGGENYCCF